MEHEPNIPAEQQESLEAERERIMERCRELWRAGMKKHGAAEFGERIFAKGNELTKKYPDAYRHLWYHAMSMSTPPEEVTITDDFPGEDSIERFLESLAEGR